jgi:hypothetical protein
MLLDFGEMLILILAMSFGLIACNALDRAQSSANLITILVHGVRSIKQVGGGGGSNSPFPIVSARRLTLTTQVAVGSAVDRKIAL